MVTLDLQPIDDLVRATIIHGNFTDTSVMHGKVARGWPVVRSSLKSFLETGIGIDVMGCSRSRRAEAAEGMVG